MGWLESGAAPSEAEDVAQHSFETTAITMILSDSIDGKIDIERALKMSVLHDWAEAVIGDFSKEVTEQIGKEVKRNIEENVIENIIVKDIPNREEYLNLWKEYSDSKTKESKLVHLADKFSILIEAKYLFQRGIQSKKIKEIWETVKEDIEKYQEEFPIVKKLLEEIES